MLGRQNSHSAVVSRPQRSLPAHDLEASLVVFSSDGKLLASAGIDSEEEIQRVKVELKHPEASRSSAKLWNISHSQAMRPLYLPDDAGALVFSPDGKLLAIGIGVVGWSASEPGTVLVWETRTWRKVRTLTVARRPSDPAVYCLAFSPDSQVLAAGGAASTVKLWKTTTWEQQDILVQSDQATSVSFSPDGKLLAVASWDGKVRLWNWSTGEEVRVLQAAFAHFRDIFPEATFSPDGKLLAMADAGSSARLWEVATGREIRTFKGHTDRVTSVAFSPDGQFLATASWDETARLWEVSSGRALQICKGHTAQIYDVGFSPDGKA